MIREKVEVKPALKVKDFNVGDLVILNAEIKEIRDIETKFGEAIVLVLEDDEGEKSIFLNQTSQNLLIDAFGMNDKDWIGEKVDVKVELNTAFKSPYFEVRPSK